MRELINIDLERHVRIEMIEHQHRLIEDGLAVRQACTVLFRGLQKLRNRLNAQIRQIQLLPLSFEERPSLPRYLSTVFDNQRALL